MCLSQNECAYADGKLNLNKEFHPKRKVSLGCGDNSDVKTCFLVFALFLSFAICPARDNRKHGEEKFSNKLFTFHRFIN